MDFVGNQVWFTILLVVHVAGAIAGIGPTFAFSVLGPNAGKAGPNGGAALLRSLLDIEKKIVTPVALVTQPLSGALLIWNRGINTVFWKEEWLWISIILFAAILYLSYLVDTPAIHRLVDAMEKGEAGTPAFQKDLAITQRLGPFFGIATIVIIVLMIWKPGSTCAGDLLRC